MSQPDTAPNANILKEHKKELKIEEEMPYAKCSSCDSDTNQRYDKYGAICEHQETKELFCVPCAMEALRNGKIKDWDFFEFGVDPEVEDFPEGYDSLAINPRCACGLLLSEDDMGVWLTDPHKEPMCECCLAEAEDEEDDEDEDAEAEDDEE